MNESTNDTTRDHDLLVNYLDDHDAACPLCGYNLRGLTVNHCPECGRGLELTVGTISFRADAWTTMSAFLWSGAGVGMTLLCQGFVYDLLDFFQYASIDMRCMMAWFILCIPLSFWTLARRQHMLRRSTLKHWLITAAVAAATVFAWSTILLNW